MENDNKVQSWDLGEPNSADMLEMVQNKFGGPCTQRGSALAKWSWCN